MGNLLTVIVGNVGTVYRGRKEAEAREVYDDYVAESNDGHGRASGEPVTMLLDDEIVSIWEGTNSEEED